MRIAFIVESFPKLSESFIISQIAGLIEQGHEVHIFADTSTQETKMHREVDQYSLLEKTTYLNISTNKNKNYAKALYLSVTSFLKSPKAIVQSWRSKRFDEPHVFSKFLLPLLTTKFIRKSTKYDIVHCHFGRNGLKGAFLKRAGLMDGKLITTFHGIDLTSDIKIFGGDAYDRLFEFGDLFLPISSRWEQRLIELGCDKDKILIHRMGVDCSTFTFKPREFKEGDKIQLVSIARLVEKKGIEYSLRALSKLTKKNKHIHYTIIGDGPLRQVLEQLSVTLKIDNYVSFVGWKEQNEVVNILNNSDVLLAPSVTSKNGDQEGIPVTLMEAMAMGMPVISTWHSGIPELVKDGVSGFLVPERDSDALAKRIQDLIDSPEMASLMGLEGRREIEKTYDLKILSDQLVDIYTNLLTQSK